ncbi:hypothetical protein EYF80_027848 [Liparis tanakae]|uniref:Uncharacterized protein n=1 Tax=Liparis tanakae TaxID=230148 RepID=A0A4Z2H8J1_9TELE|nr:hypothetical protein EYF80_027848 [Liparis tanakae]
MLQMHRYSAGVACVSDFIRVQKRLLCFNGVYMERVQIGGHQDNAPLRKKLNHLLVFKPCPPTLSEKHKMRRHWQKIGRQEGGECLDRVHNNNNNNNNSGCSVETKGAFFF